MRIVVTYKASGPADRLESEVHAPKHWDGRDFFVAETVRIEVGDRIVVVGEKGLTIIRGGVAAEQARF